MNIALKLPLALAILAILVGLFYSIQRRKFEQKCKTDAETESLISELLKNNAFIKNRSDPISIRKGSYIHWGFVPLQLITICNNIDRIEAGSSSWFVYVGMLTVPMLAYFQAQVIASHRFAIDYLESKHPIAT